MPGTAANTTPTTTTMSAPSVNTTAARDALAWVTQEQPAAANDKSIWTWFWEAIQGDFNDERSTGQIAFDAGLSMIPLVDQVCDIRDLVANCRKLSNDVKDHWAWVALALTLVGLFPSLGSLVKGVLKILFLFVRKYGVDKAIDPAMTWVVSYLRRKDVQAYLRKLKVDDVFKWLAEQVRTVRAKVDASALLAAFDKGIGLMKGWVAKVEFLPKVGAQAQRTLEMVQKIRQAADQPLAEAVAPLQKLLDNFSMRLERESLQTRKGVVDAHNVHFRGTLPEPNAVRLMREAEPPPSWLSKGAKENGEVPTDFVKKEMYSKRVSLGWPKLTDKNINSFTKGGIRADEIRGPARLYRIISPSNAGMSDCWVSEAVFKRINEQGDPRSWWRKVLAVWPHWNSNGQFVVYDIPAGESLKVWRGPASAQMLTDKSNKLEGKFLEGGEEQIVFNLTETSQKADYADELVIRKVTANGGLGETISYPQYKNLPTEQQAGYVTLRVKINHPNISGPFETGWFASDYDAGLPMRVGLPNLPGQVTQLANPSNKAH